MNHSFFTKLLGVNILYKPIKIGRRHFGTNLWYAYSPKLKRTVQLHGDLEHDHWVLVELNPHVKTFCEHPSEMFDMWILWQDGSESFVEVSYPEPDQSSNAQTQEGKFLFQKAWCLERGYKYEHMTEAIIRKNLLYLDNAKQIIKFVSNRPQPVETDYFQIHKTLYENTSMRIDQLQSIYSHIPRSRIFEAISWMYYRGEIIADLYKKPLKEIEVVFNGKKESH
ncbi:hypothetical protein P4U99_21560 [Brevibacillus agri]|nr:MULTISPECIES: hypothetical protein [Brevibacillus]MCM3082072.1 hypothetical protein [Brevibacillus invocatus]MCM3432483.1 hypothetical protein [Brevibacillus invocatus]MED1645738.1 hypothetical protein [Brevibacillus agri]MED1652757.1 hypothetical protein [Brevibacillus agri]MED1689547.1 hypothetical protein [Brevibacillus agri]